MDGLPSKENHSCNKSCTSCKSSVQWVSWLDHIQEMSSEEPAHAILMILAYGITLEHTDQTCGIIQLWVLQKLSSLSYVTVSRYSIWNFSSCNPAVHFWKNPQQYGLRSKKYYGFSPTGLQKQPRNRKFDVCFMVPRGCLLVPWGGTSSILYSHLQLHLLLLWHV